MTSLKRAEPAQETAINLSSKVYVRTTRSGKVQKIVREVYLRQDIPCSSRACSICPNNVPIDANNKGWSSVLGEPLLTSSAQPFVLSESPDGTKKFSAGHYLIPDTNAFLTGIDMFESEPAFQDVIVLQTVLEEVKNRSLPIYHRLVSLAQTEEKRFYVFFNEFRMETHVTRDSGETINDRNDRAIRQAASWYQSHLQSSKRRNKSPAIVVITDDKLNRAKSKEDGLTAVSCIYPCLQAEPSLI
jgi:exosome complex exonuclease DIS3/RRP44